MCFVQLAVVENKKSNESDYTKTPRYLLQMGLIITAPEKGKGRPWEKEPEAGRPAQAGSDTIH